LKEDDEKSQKKFLEPLWKKVVTLCLGENKNINKEGKNVLTQSY